jgi:hypothetical protein
MDERERLARALGAAVIDAWGELPRDIQERLFERAVGRASDGVRHDFAKFLHDHHPRTADHAGNH